VVLQAQGEQSAQGTTLGGAADVEGGRSPDVFYRFELAAPASLDAVVERPEAEEWDTYLYLVKGTCDEAEVLARNDDDGGRNRSRITSSRLLPGSYFLVVAGFGATHAGSFTLTATFGVAAEAPANDTCAQAQVLQLGGQALQGSTALATSDYLPDVRGGDVFYRLTLAAATPLTLRVDVAEDSSLDAYVYLLKGTCGASEVVAENDDWGDTSVSLVSLEAAEPGEYLVVVAGYSARSEGAFAISATAAYTPPEDEPEDPDDIPDWE